LRASRSTILNAVGVDHWHIDGQRIPYARFLVERLEHEATAPF